MFIVLTYRDGFHKDTNYVGPILVDAQEQFLQACEKELHWKEKDNLVRKEALKAGYVKFGRGSITLIDTSNTVSDADLVRQITEQPKPSDDIQVLLDGIGDEQGWNDESKIIHLVGFLNEMTERAEERDRTFRPNLLQRFERYLIAAAKEENAAATPLHFDDCGNVLD